jgi:hypothetical protein
MFFYFVRFSRFDLYRYFLERMKVIRIYFSNPAKKYSLYMQMEQAADFKTVCALKIDSEGGQRGVSVLTSDSGLVTCRHETQLI